LQLFSQNVSLTYFEEAENLFLNRKTAGFYFLVRCRLRTLPAHELLRRASNGARIGVSSLNARGKVALIESNLY
jgi:hypothetical protein